MTASFLLWENLVRTERVKLSEVKTWEKVDMQLVSVGREYIVHNSKIFWVRLCIIEGIDVIRYLVIPKYETPYILYS